MLLLNIQNIILERFFTCVKFQTLGIFAYRMMIVNLAETLNGPLQAPEHLKNRQQKWLLPIVDSVIENIHITYDASPVDASKVTIYVNQTRYD